MATVLAPASTRTRDVAVTLFAGASDDIVRRGMPEDRLALALVDHPRVDRLLLCDPFRSAVGRARVLVRGDHGKAPELRPGSEIYSPVRLRRTDPVNPERMVARYEGGMRRAAARLGMDRPAVITAHPLVAGFGRFDWAGSVTYYAWDDWTASVPHRRWWPAFEAAHERIRATGRRVCAVSDAALRSIAPTGPHAVIPNGVGGSEWMSLGDAPDWFTAKPGPRMLYVGGLDSRVDRDQLRAAADAFPDGSLTIVGPLLDPDHFAPLQGLPNVEFRPLLPRSVIPGLMHAADVCLIPHVLNDLTVAMSPMKLFEYLAAGRPVASVDLPPIRAVEGRVVLVAPGADFVPAVRRALEIGPADEAERRVFVERNSWNRRFDELLELALTDR